MVEKRNNEYAKALYYKTALVLVLKHFCNMSDRFFGFVHEEQIFYIVRNFLKDKECPINHGTIKHSLFDDLLDFDIDPEKIIGTYFDDDEKYRFLHSTPVEWKDNEDKGSKTLEQKIKDGDFWL